MELNAKSPWASREYWFVSILALYFFGAFPFRSIVHGSGLILCGFLEDYLPPRAWTINTNSWVADFFVVNFRLVVQTPRHMQEIPSPWSMQGGLWVWDFQWWERLCSFFRRWMVPAFPISLSLARFKLFFKEILFTNHEHLQVFHQQHWRLDLHVLWVNVIPTFPGPYLQKVLQIWPDTIRYEFG